MDYLLRWQMHIYKRIATQKYTELFMAKSPCIQYIQAIQADGNVNINNTVK